MSSGIKPSKFYGTKSRSTPATSSRLLDSKQPSSPQTTSTDKTRLSGDSKEASGSASPVNVENNEVRLSNRSRVPKKASPWRWTREPVMPPSTTDSLSDSEFAALEDGLALFYDRIQRDDIIVSIGDSVLLEAAESTQPYVARVVRMYEHLAEAAMFLTIRWYLRPEETKRGRLPEHGQVATSNSHHDITLFCSRRFTTPLYLNHELRPCFGRGSCSTCHRLCSNLTRHVPV